MIKTSVYFKGGMKAVFYGDKVVFVKDGISVEEYTELLRKGLRVVTLEHINWSMQEEIEDDDE